MDKIYLELSPLIKQKADFIFYQKYYPYSLYHKCKECSKCGTNDKNICENCVKCACVKGTFNLKKSELCDYDDVKNDLVLEILRIIKNYNPEKDFEIYLYACIFDWRPAFLTKNFIKSLMNKSLTQQDEEGNETQIDIPEEQDKSKLSIQEILNTCQTEMERKICKLYLENPKLSQRKIAKKLGTYQVVISRIVKQLRKRLKIFV